MAASSEANIARLPAFVDNSRLRLALGTLLYLAQGFPQGIVYYAIPTWFAATGQPTSVMGAAAAAASLPWSFKFLAGLVVDRYTWLPMGRRRPWLIGAQLAIVLVLVGAIIASPGPTDVSFIIAFGFTVSALTAVQDVSLDALAADLTPDDEKGRLNGFMFAGKLVGIGVGMGLTGYMLQHYGFSAAMLVMLACFAVPASAVILVRERPGEKLLPCSPGTRSPEAEAVRAEGWGQVFKGVWGNIVNRQSLTVIAIIVTYGVHQALSENGQTLFAIRTVGWDQTTVSSFSAATNFVAAAFSLFFGGRIIDKVGPARVTLLSAFAYGATLLAIAFAPQLFSSDATYIAWSLVSLLPSMLFYLSTLVLAMRVAESQVAATALALIFGTQALGSTVGNAILGPADGYGGFPALFGIAAAALVVSGLFGLALGRKVGGAFGAEEIEKSGVHAEAIDLDGLT